MRIRTDGKFAHRGDTIESIAGFYGVSKTRAVLAAAEDVPRLTRAIERVLERDDLTVRQRREMAETLSTGKVTFDVVEDVEASTEL